ncbi:11080_t:CDS:2 [Ambispora gerdemannii]|uniref:11080_t:CDS:1 n=1 Tax=Ambispora gerdemannii TaxID=144530 RepID=A0A9N8YMD1_9GLOM|nr:11080_t:CDS:2 [Ambispora gerdemannii]
MEPADIPEAAELLATAKEALIARKYQIELWEKAKKDNVIAVLETGSGKTFIAVLLIKEIAAEERQLRRIRRETKLTFFLVNLVPLVFQQSKVIESNCDLKIKHFCGEMGVDLWKDKHWQKYFGEFDVLVMTAQIFLNILRHGFISMNRVNLLVFDECHHAAKRHPYNLIMREFFDRCPEKDRPKIFGMTASPVKARTGIHAASTLERNLHSKVFTASNTDELRRFVNRPEEFSITYDVPHEYQQTELYSTLWKECQGIEKFEKAFSSAEQILSVLGPWCSDRTWKYILDEINEKKEGTLDPKEYDHDLLAEEERLVQRALMIFEKWDFGPPKLDPSILSPKVIKLIQILDCFREIKDEFCGIVFVERRHTANVLDLVIREIGTLDFIKTGILVGHGTNESGDLQMRYRQQNRVINAFKNGDLNLLIATNVAEEGLDIQPCNVVIRFDFFNTLRAYIQSRGRARRKDSKYIVMIEKGNTKELGLLQEMHDSEEEMKKWCEMLPEDRKVTAGALLSYESAVSLLYYYCSSLPADNFSGTLQPEFISKRECGGYVCTLNLPSNSPVRTVVSEVFRNFGMAKKSAAFNACIALYEKKALNDNLLPSVEYDEKDHEMMKHVDEHGLVEGARKSKRDYRLKSPELWALEENPQVPEELYATILKLDLEDEKLDGYPYRTLCLLTRNQFPDLPDITLWFHSVAVNLKILPYSEKIKMDKERVDLVLKFTLRAFTSIINKEFQCELEKFTYLIAPLVRNAPINEDTLKYIDWDAIDIAVNLKHLPVDLDNISELEDAVIIDYADNLRRYFVQSIRYDMNPLAPLPEGMVLRETGCENFAQYYKKSFELDLEHPEQPLIQVRKISKVMNFLQPVLGALPIEKGKTATFIIPEFSKQYPIRASVFRSAMLLPSIFTRFDSLLLARELRLRFELPVRDDLLLVALSTPSANMEMNYERLETLGDSFLKFSVTIQLYVMFPDKHEGQLHCQRIHIICNKNLYRSAKKLHLYEYITSLPFNRRAWRPANILASIDDPEMLEKQKMHELADKTLADVVEALLGAAYLSGKAEAALKVAIAMEIPFEGITTWSQFHQNNKNPPRANPKSLKGLNIEKIEQICGGHVFRNKILIAEALTHASLPNSSTACYQRLEFLGDAILDFMTVKYLFEKYPDGSPGMITDLKDASVNNHILGAICEIMGLHKHIIHFSPKLMSGITDFCNVVNDMRAKGEAVGEYWSDIEVPKVLSDVVESMLGAAFVDSGFDITVIQNMFDKCIRPVLSTHVTPDTLKVHPVKKLTEYVQKEGCTMLLLRNHTDENSLDNDSQHCTIFIHDLRVASASSNNIRTSRKMAAQQVLDKIEANPGYFESVCTCCLPSDDKLLNPDEDDEVLID